MSAFADEAAVRFSTSEDRAESQAESGWLEWTKSGSLWIFPWLFSLAVFFYGVNHIVGEVRTSEAQIQAVHRDLGVAMERQQRYIAETTAIRAEVTRNREDIDRLTEKYAPRVLPAPKDQD